MSATGFVLNEDPTHGIATLTLDRAERHNAFDDALIDGLRSALAGLAPRPDLRALVLAANGPSFSAGADLGWMRRMAGHSSEQNRADALALASLIAELDEFPAPTLALVQGGAFGGGVGLVAACDIAIASDAARFGLTEVRLGIVPAAISPVVLAAIGARACRRLFLTGETFDAHRAHALGLVHEVVEPAQLAAARDRVLDALLVAAPVATREAKRLVQHVSRAERGEPLRNHTAELIARLRASEEGREGLSAFLEKRKPRWHVTRSR